MSKLKERQLREYIREYIKKSLREADEENADADVDSTEEAPAEEPKPETKPEPKAEPQQDKSTIELDYAKKAFISKMSSIPGATDMDTMVDTLSDVISTFVPSSEQKLALLKAIKTNIVN